MDPLMDRFTMEPEELQAVFEIAGELVSETGLNQPVQYDLWPARQKGQATEVERLFA